MPSRAASASASARPTKWVATSFQASGPFRSTASWSEPPSTSCIAMNQTPRSSPTK
jgi:hypothetical protein